MTVIFLFLCILQGGRADERELFAFVPRLSITVDADGEPKPLEGASVSLAPFFAGQEYFRSEEFQKNLEVTAAQKSKLNDVFAQTDTFRNDFMERHGRHLARNTFPSEAKKEFWDLADRTTADVKEILIEHQIRRAKELELFSRLRQKGFLAFLVDEGPALEITLDNEERARLGKQSDFLSSKIGPELEKQSETLMESVAKALDKRQIELFKKECENQELITDFLFAEFEFLKSNPLKENASKDEYLIDVFKKRFSLDWSPVDLRWTRSEFDVPTVNAVHSIARLLVENEALVVADFSPEQRAAVAAFNQELTDLGRERDDEISDAMKAGTWKAIKEQFKQKWAYLDDYSRNKLLDEILLPHQVEAILKQAERRKLRRMGPFVLLMRGHFDESMHISGDQKIKLCENIEKALEQLDGELLKLEGSFRKEMLDALSNENREKFKAALGDDPKHAHGSVYLLRKSVERKIPF